jgi:hypothetical protein
MPPTLPVIPVTAYLVDFLCAIVGEDSAGRVGTRVPSPLHFSGDLGCVRVERDAQVASIVVGVDVILSCPDTLQGAFSDLLWWGLRRFPTSLRYRHGLAFEVPRCSGRSRDARERARPAGRTKACIWN